MTDICYNKWSKQKRLLCFEIWNLELLNSASENQPKLKQAVRLNSLDGPPALGELQLMNLFPWNFFIVPLSCTYTTDLTDVCGIKEERQVREGEGEREGRKEGGDKLAKQAGKRKKKWHIYKENSAWWARTLLLNLLFLIAGGDQLEAHQGQDCRECSQQKANFLPFQSPLPMSNNIVVSSMNFTWMWVPGNINK